MVKQTKTEPGATAGDQKLRKRIGWLNKQGGFGNAIQYDSIKDAAAGLDDAAVMQVLKNMEENAAGIKDVNAWVSSALRKAKAQGGAVEWTPKASKGALVPMMSAAPGGFPMAAIFGGGADGDGKIRKRIGWLNTNGGFENTLNYQKVSEASQGIGVSKVLDVLKNVEEKKGEVKDPTAWVCAALRKAGGGTGDASMGMFGGGMPMYGSMGMFGGSVDANLDEKLRKRIGWLNKDGGFDNTINYKKVSEAASGLAAGQAMEVLKTLEGKKGEVKDPTAWVSAALRKAGGGSGMGMSMFGGGMGMFAGGVDVNTDEKLRKRIGWLNQHGGFENALNYKKVSEAASGVGASKVLDVLKSVEEKKGDVKDPTAWVTAALRKAGGGGMSMPSQMKSGSGTGKPKLGVKKSMLLK